MIMTLVKFVVVAIVTIPLSLMALASAFLEKSGTLYQNVVRQWARFILWIYGIDVTVQGIEHIRRPDRYIYISNHASMFDIPAVIAGLPDQIRIVYKEELTKVPIWGWALKYGPYISIDRGNARDAMKSLDRAAERMRNGASVLLFAEGTRTLSGKLQPFKRGAFTLAVKSGVPIIPVAINNTFGLLPKGSKSVRSQDITIVLDKPIPTAGVKGREGELKLMDEVHNAIANNYVDQS